MLGNSFWRYRELKIDCWSSRHILCEKNIKSFRMCGASISCRKVKCIWSSYFQRPLLQTFKLETTSLCLNTRLLVNKSFPNSHNFTEINVNVCLLCTHHVMTSIILHARRPNCQLKVIYAPGFYVSADFLFSHFEERKSILMCWSSLINSVSFVFCKFNRLASWNEGKTIILVRSSFRIPK